MFKNVAVGSINKRWYLVEHKECVKVLMCIKCGNMTYI